MSAISDPFLRSQLEERQRRLQSAVEDSPRDRALLHLLDEVDSALKRMEQGTYGLCETCHDSIEKERLITDPLVRYCLDHLTSEQQRALEQDLELAARIQRALLPPQDLHVNGWQIYHHYAPAGPVSGDYCDVIRPQGDGKDLMFFLGDVSGKGVAASMLMTQLHAMFRTLASVGFPLDQLVALANRLFCETTLAGQFATLVCGRASASGEVQICNAGHLPMLWLRQESVVTIEATGIPLGMFSDRQFPVRRINLAPGDALFLYSDGLSEALDASSVEYGASRLATFVAEQHTLAPQALTAACLQDVHTFSGRTRPTDDLTIMVLRRTASA